MQRTTRAMERSNSMRREKRGLEGAEGEEAQQPERKRPALASVIVEALKVDSLQKLCSSLEPILRRVVSEEVERALAKLGPAMISGSKSSPKRIEGPDGRNLQLHFRSRLSLPLFTGGKVEGEQGAAIHVVMVDGNTGHVITSGPESSVKLDVVVLEGDFNNENDEDWTQEEFEGHVVKEREGKRPLLTGELIVALKEGVGTLGEITFTDNSSWIRSRKFRLGLKVASGYCEGIRVREAKTDAFTVKDHRGELYKKHYPPALNDEVWRLEKIGKDGSFHKRLNKAGIYTVEDFLRLVVRDSQRLRNVLGSGMSNKMWEILVEHAKTCMLSGKLYIYHADETRNVGVLFNNIYELSGLIAAGQYYTVDILSDSQKVYVDSLVKKAYENWMHVVEYDGKALMNFKQMKRPSMQEYSPFDNQVSASRLPISATLEQPAMDSNMGVSGYDHNSASRYPSHPNPHIPTISQNHFDVTQFAPQNQLMSNPNQPQMMRNDNMGLALGPPQSSSEFQIGTASVAGSNLPYDDWSRPRDNKGAGVDDFFSEEDIRMRSHEMLENEDMQHLLRYLNMANNGGNVTDDSFNFAYNMPTPTANFSFDEERTRSSGKAVVGWLKLKAALRWGIFIRKKAAEKRAQLVELDD